MSSIREAGTSSAGGTHITARGDTDVAKLRTGIATGRPVIPQSKATSTSQLIVLKDGEPIPEGYKYVVVERAENAASGRQQSRGPTDIVDLSTPPKSTAPSIEKGVDTGKSKAATKRNLTRNSNRKANATFARELKESLATGQPTTTHKVYTDANELKAAWHAVAKEVAYKFLDLTKESWKEYNIFEKTAIHNEVNEQIKFDPPIDGKRIDKYLSCHLRTSRAVWKAHWKKYGASNRHHNCPDYAWEKLTKWWPTTQCQEEAAEMASRRARVESASKVGRSSLLDRMDEEV